jgi:hypothetical protein
MPKYGPPLTDEVLKETLAAVAAAPHKKAAAEALGIGSATLHNRLAAAAKRGFYPPTLPKRAEQAEIEAEAKAAVDRFAASVIKGFMVDPAAVVAAAKANGTLEALREAIAAERLQP